MKSKPKSAFIAATLCLFAAFALGGCGESNDLPHILGSSEVPADIVAQPRVVEVPSQTTLNNPAWPRLGDVPAKPQTFSPKPVIDQAMKEMEYDRSQAQQASEEQQQTLSPLKPPQFHPY